MNPPPLFPLLVERASQWLTQGHADRAYPLLTEALDLAPRDVAARWMAAQICLGAGQANAALEHLEVCIQEAPMIEAHWTHYIRALLQVGAVETAAQAIEFGTQFGLSVAAATQLAQDYVTAQSVRAQEGKPEPEVDFWSLPPAPPWPDPPASASADLTYITPPRSKGRRYVIFSPNYRHNSAGIRVLYELQKWLVRAGYDAIVITSLAGLRPEQFADDIVIYPEVVPGNPLKSKRVVRYLLNTPGKIGGDRRFAPHEIVIAHSKDFDAGADLPILYIPPVESLFRNLGKPRNLTAFYVGKGKNTLHHPPSAVEITRDWPSTRASLAEFLNQCTDVFLYDNLTALSREAELCGCHIHWIDPHGAIKPYPLGPEPTRSDTARQLHDFIAHTQTAFR